MRAQFLGVGLGAVDEAGPPPAQEVGAEQVHARCVAHDTAVMADPALVVEDRNVEPRVVGAIAGRPDDRADVGTAQVEGEHR